MTTASLLFSSPLFQSQDSRSRADFEGTHILAGPAHGGQGWVVIAEFKLAALEVLPLEQCHTAVTVILKGGGGQVRPSKEVLMGTFSVPFSPSSLPTQLCRHFGSTDIPRDQSILSITIWEAGMFRSPQPSPFCDFD